ncbi:MAG: Rpn family recombination-promoting nuclease/putative transposase [Desulfitobacteriaceae bacterium]
MNIDLIDLKIDFAFKLIFGREGQEPVLVAFLNAVLKPKEGKQIQSLIYTNSELNKENAEDKKASLDIRAETEDGRHINIEIQLKNEHNMGKRSLYYWAELYSRQMVQNKAYETLKDTITINILNFEYLAETEKFHSVFRLLEEEKHFLLTDALAMHFIEMPKLRRKWKNKEVAPQKNPLVRWLFLLDGNENEEIRKQLEVIAMEDPMIERAMRDWEAASADPQLREQYFDRKKAILDELAAVEASRLNADRAKAEGIAEGVVIGEVKGKAETICQYLEVRFGAESQALQETVRTIANLDALSRIINQIFIVTHLDEATALIQVNLVSQ